MNPSGIVVVKHVGSWGWLRAVLLIGLLLFCFCADPADGGTAVNDEGRSAWTTAVLNAVPRGGLVPPEEDAPGAVDGKITNGFGFHTGHDDPPWWQVDLGAALAIDRIVIFNPHAPARLSHFSILLSDDGAKWRSIHEHGKTDDERRSDVSLGGASGRFIRIEAKGKAWMHLAEVQVFGMADPKRNLALGQPCSQSSISAWSKRSVPAGPSKSWQADVELGKRVLEPYIRMVFERESLDQVVAGLVAEECPLDDARWAAVFAQAREQGKETSPIRQQLELLRPEALARALAAFARAYPGRYEDSAVLQLRVEELAERLAGIREGVKIGDAGAWAAAREAISLQREILFRVPQLDFDQLVLLRRRLGSQARSAMGASLGVGNLELPHK